MAFEVKATSTAANEQAPPDLLRAILGQMMQAAIQAEFDRFLGAGPWQRTGERRGWRNGSKRRRLHTRVGTIELRIPKDREGRFQPSLFERYQRSEKAFVLALVEMYIQGVSTRKVQKVVEQLCGVLVSASQVSAVVKGLDADLEAWRKRSLGGQKYPYLVVDAHYEKVRREGRVLPTAVLWVIGDQRDGLSRASGCVDGPEREPGELGASLPRPRAARARGRRVRGERRARRGGAGAGAVLPRGSPPALPGALREERALARQHGRAAELVTGLRDAWSAPAREEARARLVRLIDRMREKKVSAVADWLEETAEQTLACYDLPAGVHRLRLRSTNSVEHDHAEIRRRTRVVRIFPNDASLVRLASALAIERNEKWMERRYLGIPEAPAAETQLKQSA